MPGVGALVGGDVGGGGVVEGVVDFGDVVVGAEVDWVTEGGVAEGATASVGALRTGLSFVVGASPACLVVVRCVVEVVVDGWSGGNSGGNAVVAESADDELSDVGGTSGKAVACRSLNASAATVANPVATAIPAAAHTTSRCGRASGSS